MRSAIGTDYAPAMPLVTLVFHLLAPQWKGSVWTQTLRLAGDDSGVMTWRRQSHKGGVGTERWTLTRGGEPNAEVAEDDEPPRPGISKRQHWRMAIRYDAHGAHVRYVSTEGVRGSATIDAPKGISHTLPTPRFYRRTAHPGGRYRFTKFDAWARQWDTIEGTYAGTRNGAPIFREHNLNERVTWTFTLDRDFEIAGVDLGRGYSLRLVSKG